MLTLDKETFSYWVTHPDDLTSSDLVQLKESLAAYPYCQSLYTLTAKASSIHQRSQAVTSIRQAAAHALSRNALRKLIENEFQWSENLLTKLNELSAKHVPIPEDYQQESYALFKSKTSLGNGFPQLSLLRLPSQPNPSVTVPIPEDPTLAETNLQSDLEEIEESATELPTVAELERQRQLELIDSFIQKEPSIPRISPARTKSGESGEQEDLTKRNKPIGNTLATESFAKILEKQGKFDKALEIYEKLMVKNPEKNAYFTAKISELTNRSKHIEE